MLSEFLFIKWLLTPHYQAAKGGIKTKLAALRSTLMQILYVHVYCTSKRMPTEIYLIYFLSVIPWILFRIISFEEPTEVSSNIRLRYRRYHENKPQTEDIIWAASWQNQQNGFLTGQMPMLIWVFAGHTVTLLVSSWGSSDADRMVIRLFLLGTTFCSDRSVKNAQADLSLLWAHSHTVGFVMSRLICTDCILISNVK